MTVTIEKDYAIRMYLKYWCDYLTLDKFAEDHNLTTDQAETLINQGRAERESKWR